MNCTTRERNKMQYAPKQTVCLSYLILSIFLLNEGDFSTGNDNDKKYRSRFHIDLCLKSTLSDANNNLTFFIQIYDIHTDFLDALHEKFGARYEFKIDYGERIIRRLRFKADFLNSK